MVVVATQTGVLLAVLLPLISLLGVRGAAAAWLPAYAAAQLVSLLFVRQTIGRPLAGAGPQLLAILSVSSGAALAAGIVRVWLSGTSAIAGGMLLGLATGAILLVQLNRRMELGLGVWLRPPAAETAG
jgi:hypothetical protein